MKLATARQRRSGLVSSTRAKQAAWLELHPGRVTLAGSVRSTPGKLLTGQKRTNIVNGLAATMRMARPTPFACEGPMRAGLRAALCELGHGWARADIEAIELIGAALRQVGARRPSWIDGQPEHVHEHDDCLRCGGPLDPASMDPWRFAYCSKLCRDADRLHRETSYRYYHDRRVREAYYLARKSRRPRVCPECGASFLASRDDAKWCSTRCAAKARRVIEERSCETCGSMFRPPDSAHAGRYCGKACADRARRKPDKVCPTCGAHFRGKSGQVHCSRKCGAAQRRGKPVRNADAPG